MSAAFGHDATPRGGATPGEDSPRPFREPVTGADLDRICLLPHDGSRNWLVTMAYWDLARMTAAYTHAFDEAPEAAAARGESGRLERYFCAARVCQEARLGSGDTPATAVADEDPESVVVPTKLGAERPAGPSRLNGGDPGHGPPRLTANFCHFAMWSSLTLGRDIRNTRLPHRFDELELNGLRRHLTSLVIDVRRTDRKRLSKALGLGQKVVLRDVGYGLVNLMRLGLQLDAADGRDFDVANKEDTDKLVETWAGEIGKWLEQILDEDGPRATHELRSKDLAYGLASYHLARRVAITAWAGGAAATRDGSRNLLWKWVAELVLRGTILIASYEQQRVQQVLRFPIDDFPTSFFTERLGLDRVDEQGAGRWRRRVERRTRQELSNHVSDLWGRLFTDQVLAIKVGDELLRLGRDLPFPPGSERFYPGDLAEPCDRWLQMLLRRFDHSYGDGQGTQARIWSDYDDRMNYIVNFMWSRAQEPGLWQEPFEKTEIRDLRAGKFPRTENEPVD
jgi:hypothetical protein